METDKKVIATDAKEFDGLLIMDRFSEKDEPTEAEKAREERKAAYEKRRAEKQGE